VKFTGILVDICGSTKQANLSLATLICLVKLMKCEHVRQDLQQIIVGQGGFDKIEKLQFSSNQQIYELSKAVLEMLSEQGNSLNSEQV